MSRNEEKEYFTDGVSEDIISALTKLGTIRVAARNSAFQFKGKTPDIREVGRKLKVDTVLTGSVRWAGNRLRITVQLSNVADGFEIWSERYERVMDDIFDIQDEISHAVVEKLKVQLAGGAEEAIVPRSTENLEAYGLYLKGKQQVNRLTHDGFRRAIQYFEQAAAADPGYVYAYTGLAVSYGYLGVHGWVPPKEVFPIGLGHSKKALELDDSVAEAHTTLAMIQHWYEWDFEAAESSYKKALERKPGEVEALTMYALLLAILGRRDEAVSLARRAVQWDPISLDVNRMLAYVYYLTRCYREAFEQAEKLNNMNPAYFPSSWTVAMALGHQGDFEGAVAAYHRAVDLSGGDPISEAGLGWALGLAGRTEEAQAIIDRFKKRQSERYFSNYFIAWVYVGLKDWDAALDWLEKAYQEREGMVIKLAAESLWDPMRENPRFQDLVSRIGLPNC